MPQVSGETNHCRRRHRTTAVLFCFRNLWLRYPERPRGADSPLLCDVGCHPRGTSSGWGWKCGGRAGVTRGLELWPAHLHVGSLGSRASSQHGGLGGLELPSHAAAWGSGMEAVWPFMTQPWESPSSQLPLCRLKKSQAFPEARGEDTGPTFQWEEHQGTCSHI